MTIIEQDREEVQVQKTISKRGVKQFLHIVINLATKGLSFSYSFNYFRTWSLSENMNKEMWIGMHLFISVGEVTLL